MNKSGRGVVMPLALSLSRSGNYCMYHFANRRGSGTRKRYSFQKHGQDQLHV